MDPPKESVFNSLQRTVIPFLGGAWLLGEGVA